MAVNYFLHDCRTESCNKRFGLCDKPDPIKEPAYLTEDQEEEWIAEVRNPNGKWIQFYAIDHCVSIPQKNDAIKQEKRCDGCLVVEEHFIFVELKDCKLRGKGKNWRITGKTQLKETINRFLEENPTVEKSSIRAYLCNKRHTNNYVYQQSQDDFSNEIGVGLIISREIEVQDL